MSHSINWPESGDNLTSESLMPHGESHWGSDCDTCYFKNEAKTRVVYKGKDFTLL